MIQNACPELSCINRLLFIKSNIHYVKSLAPMVQTFCCYVLTLVMESGYWECGGCGCTIAQVQNSGCIGVGTQILSHFGVDSKLWHHSIWHGNDVVLTCWIINVLVVDVVLTCQTINPHINDVALMCQTIIHIFVMWHWCVNACGCHARK